MTAPKGKAPDKAVEPTICLPCFAGVWPPLHNAASCEHGTWERPVDEALADKPVVPDEHDGALHAESERVARK